MQVRNSNIHGISNKIQRYTVYFVWKLFYMFQVVPPPTMRSAKQLYLHHLVLVTPLLLPAAIAIGSSNILTNTRCCRYSCLHTWWWVVVPPETCRAVSSIASKFVPNFPPLRLTPHAQKMLGIIKVDFNATSQLLIIYSALVKILINM
jgi:hypothetical protein